MNEIDKAWLACLIDTEGCISKARPQKRTNLRWNFVIGNTDVQLLEKARQIIGDGAHIYLRKNNSSKFHSHDSYERKPLYVLNVDRRLVLKQILEEILPYLITKKQNALDALDWLKTVPLTVSEAQGIRSRKMWDDPLFREKMLVAHRTPQYREKRRRIAREVMLRRWADPNTRKKYSDINSKTMLKNWKNPDFRRRRMNKKDALGRWCS